MKAKYSIWCDFIENSFLDNEFIQLLRADKFCGATSNPSIFKNAISTSAYYKNKISQLNIKDKKELFLFLALEDIKKAAKKMAYLYKKDNNDGFISYELEPTLCDNAAASIAQGLRIANLVNMPNLMIKVPATKAGYEVMYTLAAHGISINATLIFSQEQAKACNDAISSGIKKSKSNNKGVVSIFVSRLDAALNYKYSQKNQIGIQNAIYCANSVKDENVRALFASTGVKSKDLNKDYYLEELAFLNTINTAPLDAILAYKNKKSPIALTSEEKAKEFIFKTLSIEEYNQACKKLLNDGLEQFNKAYDDILNIL
ncbi:transaldolase [Campylobacter canadensis]|uniref:Transaldolase n=1 Tax=Campylobacter canadensis TaxID=449520 RepID=A0ABS7WR19_9BACT|nr:transaldolase [Campylobacter canadensis]MBZ7987210.1 transaldolase [Campylobacter canadensis]MBZ7994438.1 transaldolase [Campylobacter canadensis]MBZ7996475.1 transaldolase [Campylobacter canadensis]MBZ7998166.1 transaldolase [Campylobacter canadensis]MBZ7999847.1 transaldolase [Campylobacter canadensis]